MWVVWSHSPFSAYCALFDLSVPLGIFIRCGVWDIGTVSGLRERWEVLPGSEESLAFMSAYNHMPYS